jgi:hypothetical protein
MGKLRDVLQGAPLRMPSAELSQRVTHALDEAEARGAARPWFRQQVPLWACAVLAIVSGLLGYLGRAGSVPTRPQVVYVVPAEGELRRILMGEASPRPEPPLRVEVRVKVPSKES